jgi:hypothetical protein
MLQGKAEEWWKGTKIYLEGIGTPITWENFLMAFFDKYFPDSVKNEKEAEFIHLQQVDMTIGEYVAKFEELSKFSSELKNNPDDSKRAVRFERGLRPKIKDKVATLEIRDYSTLVKKCKIVEKSIQEMNLERTRMSLTKQKLHSGNYQRNLKP